MPDLHYLCCCCGEPCNDIRPHNEYGGCFACGMAGARFKIPRGCRRCQGKPPIDMEACAAHNRAVQRVFDARADVLPAP